MPPPLMFFYEKKLQTNRHDHPEAPDYRDYRGDSTQRRHGRPGGCLQGTPVPIGYVAGSPATEGTINNNNHPQELNMLKKYMVE